MVAVNSDKTAYQPPYSVVILDATDAYYYADIMDNMQEVAKLDDYAKGVALADALFVAQNYKWESLQEMNELDGGCDVRIYDSMLSCVYAAHTRYEKNWFGDNASDVVFSRQMQNAIRFSIEVHEIHQKQKRKGKDIPYITHPITVGLILAHVHAGEDVIIAGILHDTIEDSHRDHKVTPEMLIERFGENVASLVESVTESNKELPWEDRKREALAHIATFSHDALLVKSADVLSNVSELLNDLEREGENVWLRFNAPKEKFLENTNKVISTALQRWPESPLARDLALLKDRLSQI